MIEEAPHHHRYHYSSLRAYYAGFVAILGVLLLFGSVVGYFLNKNWATQTQIVAGVGVALVLMAVVWRPDTVRTVLAGRPIKYASNALVMSLAFVGILALFNVLALRYDQEFDLTENGQFTLSEQTIQILEKVDRPVQIIGFFEAGAAQQKVAEDYLERYRRHSKFISYEFHDPNIEPALAQTYELSDYGLVFVSGTNRHEAAVIQEQAITTGLLRVIDDSAKKVYFVTGHGEPSPTDTSAKGYSQIAQTFMDENYQVESLNLASATSIPADATLVILAGAEGELLEAEVTILDQWMATGGKLMLLVDPFKPAPLATTLQQYGVQWNDDLVADADNHLVGLAPTSPLIVQYPFHEITQGLDGYLSFFPLARSITIVESRIEARETVPLLTTGPSSWSETNISGTALEFDEGEDTAGPVHIGIVSEDWESGARLVVFGSNTFITNENLLNEVANRDLFMNSANWLAEAGDLISIRPKPVTPPKVFLTPLQANLTIFTTLIVIPLSIFFAGVAMWWRRR